MTVVTRYLLREFTRMAAACLAGFLVLFIAVDFMERADDFLRHRAGASDILAYYLYRIPSVFTMIAPVAVLLAVLITVSLRARTNEFTALYSGGIGLGRACVPILAGCAVITAVAFGVSEFLVPPANRAAKAIAREKVRPGRIAAQFTQNRYWIRGDNAVASAQVVDPARGELHGFQYLEMDGDFRLLRRVDARVAAAGTAGRWVLREGAERLFAADDPRPRPFISRDFAFPVTIQAFLDGETPPEEMTYAQLSGYIAASRARGYDVRRYETDRQAKVSYPLLNIIVSLIGIPFALVSPRKGSVWRSIGLGIAIAFLCWMGLSASLSLGRKGVAPPWAAAWLPDVLLAGAGLLLFRRTPR